MSAFRCGATNILAGDQHCAMLQLQSCDLPRNARSAWRIAELTEPVDLHAAVAARSEVSRHHAVWLSKNRLSVASVDRSDPHAAAVREIKVPTAGRVLASPLSLQDGGVCVPLEDPRGEHLTFARFFPDADPILRELDLGPGRPLGPYVCFWEYDAWGHFAWSAAEGCEVFYSRLPLADRDAAPSAPRPIHVARGPILRIEAFLDQTSRARARSMFAQTHPDGPPDQATAVPPAEAVFWIAAVEDGRLTCSRVRALGAAAQVECALTLPQAAPLRVSAGCVNRAQHLCLLLADAEGGLHYTSTEHPHLTPLHELMSDDVLAEQIAGLIPGGDGGIAPWVLLRYLDPRAGRVRYARIEPFRRDSPGQTSE